NSHAPICWIIMHCTSRVQTPITAEHKEVSRKMSKKYAIGVDYGTQSGRAVLVDLSNGAEVAEHVTPYTHHVMDEKLPVSGIKLEHDWALQHPLDYIEVLERSVPAVMKESGISSDDVIGL